jgi:hypothetical protein
MGHKKDRSRRLHRTTTANGCKSHGDAGLFLPGALFVTIQAQLLAPFMFIYLCLAAFFE